MLQQQKIITQHQVKQATHIRHTRVVKNIVRVVHHAVDARELVHHRQHDRQHQPLEVLRLTRHTIAHRLGEQALTHHTTLHQRSMSNIKHLCKLLSGQGQGRSHLLRAGYTSASRCVIYAWGWDRRRGRSEDPRRRRRSSRSASSS